MTNINNDVMNYIASLNAAFEARKEYEIAHGKDASANIHKTLSKVRKSMTRDVVATCLLASNVDADFINASVRASNRFNVYAIEKVDNIACALLKAESVNHYTRAILATALAFEKNDLVMTRDEARSACSLALKVKDAKREKLVSKYKKHIDASTASTQSSSSLEALVTFNILARSKDDQGNDTFKTIDNEATRALIERLS
jgi:hypothetical protein